MKTQNPLVGFGSRLAYLVAFLIVFALVMALLFNDREISRCLEKVILALIASLTAIAIQTLRELAKGQYAFATQGASGTKSRQRKRSAHRPSRAAKSRTKASTPKKRPRRRRDPST
jgi:hypothetical protein